MIPKKHKSPIGSRFIIASKRCVLNFQVKTSQQHLNCYTKSLEKYHSKSKFYSRVNSFWVIQNYKTVIYTSNKLSNRKAANSAWTHDFPTLYTSIPHDELIKTLNSVIGSAFKGKTQKISVNKCDIANWCKCSNYFVFDTRFLKKLLNILLEIATLLLEITLFIK